MTPGSPSTCCLPHLYDLVVWGFTERNDSGQWVLRRDIQDRLDGHVVGDHGAAESEESPLYVGFRCQPCWEAAVTLVAYRRHLCPRDGTDGLTRAERGHDMDEHTEQGDVGRTTFDPSRPGGTALPSVGPSRSGSSRWPIWSAPRSAIRTHPGSAR